jgi:hypothetical protein
MFFDTLTAVTTIVNIFFVYLVYILTRKDKNPKLYVQSNLEDAKWSYDRSVNHDIDEDDFLKKGFPEIPHDTLVWKLEIHNNGEYPATNVEVDYSIVIKRSDFDYGIDEADIINHKFVPYKTLKRKISFDYIPPNGEKVVSILYIRGEYPEADLSINKLKSSERTYIKEPVLLQKYEHPGFQTLADSHDFRLMIGSYK